MDLRTWRTKVGLTLEAFGERVDCTKAALSDIERAKKRPSTDLAKRIEAATRGEVSAAVLLGLEQSTKRRKSLREDAAPFGDSGVLNVSVPLPAMLQEDIGALGIDAEAVARDGALRALKEATAAAWREANKDVIEQNRRYIEKHGTFAEQMGLI